MCGGSREHYRVADVNNSRNWSDSNKNSACRYSVRRLCYPAYKFMILLSPGYTYTITNFKYFNSIYFSTMVCNQGGAGGLGEKWLYICECGYLLNSFCPFQVFHENVH